MSSIDLHGQARSYGQGSAIADVDIRFADEENGDVFSTSTDSHGVYSVTLPESDYTVDATRAGYRHYRDTAVAIRGDDPGMTSQHYPLRLKPLHATGAVEGRALEQNPDGSAGAPIADVAITFSCLDTGYDISTRASTDATGRYSVVLAQGSYLATANHLGYDQVSVRDLRVSATGLTYDFIMGLMDIGPWVASHPSISSAIIWESPGSIQAYPAWQASMQSDLEDAFRMAWNLTSVLQVDPVPNKKALADTDSVVQIVDPADAWPLFLSHVAQSLAVEIGHRVPWSIAGYSPTGLAQLFDSRETFRWNGGAGGYEITSNHGVALPCRPDFCYGLLRNWAWNMIGPDRPTTIAALLDWCRSNLRHFSGGWDTANFYNQWQYRGFPPVLTMLMGTSHLTAGCWGTTGFLRAVLRTVNIPVRLVSHDGHAQPHFVEDGLYLSHGDDPYNRLTTSVPPMPISEILINQAQFDGWFGAGISDDDRAKNVGRRPVDLSLIYLPTELLQVYCRDMANGKAHSDGEVYDMFKNVYTVAQLEAVDLWGMMDSKISSQGGCNHL